jgi:hypothetical protein
VAAIRHLRGTAETTKAGPPQVPAMNVARNVRRLKRTSYAAILKPGTLLISSVACAIPPNPRG